jgi:CMP/dCMP kinase
MKLTLSGTAGSGKGTIAELLIKKYNLTYYDVGNMRREEATRRNMTLAEFNTWSETHPQGDVYFDKLQEQIGKTQDNFIMVGRLSWHFIPDAIKILLLVDEIHAARRIYEHTQKQGRLAESFTTLSQAIEQVKTRNISDISRYQKQYGIHTYDPSHFDIVIDTTDKSITLVYTLICDAITKISQNQNKSLKI